MLDQQFHDSRGGTRTRDPGIMSAAQAFRQARAATRCIPRSSGLQIFGVCPFHDAGCRAGCGTMCQDPAGRIVQSPVQSGAA